MSERYSKLYTLAPNLYIEGSPIVISAGALLKDTTDNSTLVQLKLKSIYNGFIKAVTVEIVPHDSANRVLGNSEKFQYMDLSLSRNGEFGQKVPIPLLDATTRSFTVNVVEVVFGDMTFWSNGEESQRVFEAIPPSTTLEQRFYQKEMVKQYQIAYGNASKFLPNKEKDLWICSCGCYNHVEEFSCFSCKQSLCSLESADFYELDKKVKERLEEEQIERERKIEEEKVIADSIEREQVIAKKAAKLKAKKIGYGTAITITCLLVLLQAIPSIKNLYQYNSAMNLMEKQDYKAAFLTFTELSNYEDSSSLAQDSYYSLAKESGWLEKSWYTSEVDNEYSKDEQKYIAQALFEIDSLLHMYSKDEEVKFYFKMTEIWDSLNQEYPEVCRSKYCEIQERYPATLKFILSTDIFVTDLTEGDFSSHFRQLGDIKSNDFIDLNSYLETGIFVCLDFHISGNGQRETVKGYFHRLGIWWQSCYPSYSDIAVGKGKLLVVDSYTGEIYLEEEFSIESW